MNSIRLLIACLAAIISPCSLPWASAADAGQTKPNVVFILTDNHGPWTLGCYGNPDIRTPHIDRLAKEGTLFTRAFAPNAVCSPTRATLLTGLMPSQHGVHCFLRAGGVQTGTNAYYTLREFRTLPKILSEAGYVCGMAGKWHLGANLQPHDGFTSWITMPRGDTRTMYGEEVIENGETRKEPTYLTDLWTRRGIEFVEKNKERPFFLYLPYNGPYGLGRWMLEPAKNRHAAYYADKPLPSFPREPMHPWLDATRAMHNNPVSIRRYAAEISGVDDGVGEIMAALRQHGLDRRTLVIFTGDQGLAGGQSGLWGMGDHTKPLSAFDCQITVPLVYWQPGRIKAGQRADIMVNHYDFLTSLMHHLGLENQLAAKPESPGRNYAPVLRGQTVPWDNVVF
ncbi:MAG: hypothetical protein FJ388_15505, partial [Verrucomicrobia bacterium]|nr:hypothetical protein [Verrucomicrobiota bacterium]